MSTIFAIFNKRKYDNVGKMCGSSGHESCESQFDQLPLHEWEESRNGGAYDIGSVMHYGKKIIIKFNIKILNLKWLLTKT